MKLFRTMPLALAVAAVAACTPQTPDAKEAQATTPAPASATPQEKDVTPMPDASHTPTAQLQPPRPDSVLYFISDKDGDGATSYETVNGSWITFWYGLQFDLGGKHYYTGFAWETPELFGEDLKHHDPAPGTKVTLAHATFIANPPGSKEPWKWEGSEPYIGEFGGNERGNALDTDRKPQTWNTPSGGMLLAVPTWYLASGVKMRTIEVLLFNPHELLKTDDHRWRYLATLDAGSDNDADCGPESAAAIPCRDVTGTLAFLAHAGEALPALQVTLPAASGHADNVIEYRYDAASKTYRSTSR